MRYSNYFKWSSAPAWVLGLALLSAGPAQAQWSIGAIGISADGGFRGIERDTLMVPSFGYEGERVYFRGLEFGYRLNPPAPGERPAHQWNLVLTGAPFRFRPEDSSDPQMQQLDRRQFSAEVALDYKYRTSFGVIDARVGQDIRGNGHRARLTYGFPFTLNPRRWMVTPSVGATFISGHYTDYYYGVSEEESERTGLAQYSSQDAVNPSASLSGYWRLGEDWSLFGAYSARRMSSKIADSPMASGRNVNVVVIGLSRSL